MRTVFRPYVCALVTALGLSVAANSMAHKHGAPGFPGKGNNCLKIDRPELYKCKLPICNYVTLRDQYTPEYLADLAVKLVHDYSSKKDCPITLPVFDWTGTVDKYRTTTNFPTETINASSLTPDGLAERILTLSFLLTQELKGQPGNDRIAEYFPDFYSTERAAYLYKMADVMGELSDRYLNKQIIFSDAQAIGLGLGANHMANVADRLADPNSLYDFNFDQTYSDYMHRYYNQLTHFATASSGFLLNASFPGGLTSVNRAPLFGDLSSLTKLPVVSGEIEALNMIQIVKDESDAVGKYFWPRVYVDPANAMLFTFNGTDPDGYTKPTDVTLANYDLPGQVMRWEFLDQRAVNFKDLRVLNSSGSVVAAYEDVPTQNSWGTKHITEYRYGADAADMLVKMENIYNTAIKPAYQQLSTIAAVRRAESHNDFYAGSWRAKFKKVNGVTRDADGKAISANVILADGSAVTVPLDWSKSRHKKVKQAIADVAEMDGWFLRNLAVAQDMRNGAKFSLLSKKDLSRGICGGTATGTTPYQSVTELVDNYGASVKIVGVDADLPDLVYQSGQQGAKFFYDLKEFLADRYVKKHFTDYGFADEQSAGLCKNNGNHVVTYAEVRDSLNAKNLGGLATSDVCVLGRHYGYNADGSPKMDEWSTYPTKLKYGYKDFDYIYRQHYTVSNPSNPVPDTICSPGHIPTRVSLATFNAIETITSADVDVDKPGTYFRWKLDWVAQKLSAFVVSNAVQKNILSQSFVDNYFTHTVVDTNDPNGVQCGFGLSHSPQDETVNFRIIGKSSGSASSNAIRDLTNKKFRIQLNFATADPRNLPTIANTLGTLLHEGALGHGFDNVPNNIELFRGVSQPASWLTNTNAGLILQDVGNGQLFTGMTGPSRATLGEGWATYGEILGVIKQLNVLFDSSGCPDASQPNDLGMFLAMSSLSRIAGRQVISVAENYSKYAWSFYHSVAEFKNLTDLVGIDAAQFNMRFIAHPTQQTTYATGLITNLGILSYLKEQAAARGSNCTVNEPAFNELRITRTDYILGALLQKYIDANIDTLIKCN